ncbi:hypothetical protein [Haliangium sp.]|uniref:hypothetical protein n=1 Tax=Haliangium sp. TaxID=2663208 RepID=UPI003D0F973A
MTAAVTTQARPHRTDSGARMRAFALILASLGLTAVAGCGDDATPNPSDPVAVYSSVLQRQKQTIAAAFASIDAAALDHKRAFRDQVVAHMRDAYGLEVGAGQPGAAAEAAEAVDSTDTSAVPRVAPADDEPDLGSVLIFAARPDVLPRGYWQPGVVIYQPFQFSELTAAEAFIAERAALGENIYLRAAPASAEALDERLVFSDYPAIAMTAFHEALHNRIQLPLAIEEPLHTLLALSLTEAFAATLPATTEAEQRLRDWVGEGAVELRQDFTARASEYSAFLASLDPAAPDPEAIRRYAVDLLGLYRDADGSDAQARYGRADAAPYITSPLVRELRILALEPAEQGLIGTALVADYSTYERRFAEVEAVLAPHLDPDRVADTLTALLDHTVPESERYSFDQATEDQALAWIADTLLAAD